MDRLSVVLTLIHGTFGQNSEWTEEYSEFSLLLTRVFEKRGLAITLQKADWSGSNSHTRRIEDMGKVNERLRHIQIWHPDSYHFAIAHSHGGTVLRYAIRDGYSAAKLSGYVTLGTPFISCKPRNLEWAIRRFSFPFFLLCFPFLYLSLYLVALHVVSSKMLPEDGSPDPHQTLAFVLLFAAWAFAVFISYRATFWLLEWLRRLVVFGREAAAETSARLNFSGKLLPHLCLMNADDEAANLLGTFRAIANMPSKLITLFLWVFPYLTGATFTALALTLLFGHEGLAPLADYSSQIAWTCGSLIFLGLSVITLAVFGPKFSRALPLAFGGETVFDNLFSDILSTPVPPDTPCTALNIMDIGQPSTPTCSIGSKHSAFFTTPEKTVNAIADWVIETIEEPSNP